MSEELKAAPNYNTPIPSSITTPDKVETRVGTLEFFDGIPTEKTAALLYDNLDYLRGVETFLNGLPAPAGEYFLLFRWYAPTERVINLDYKLPAIANVASASS